MKKITLAILGVVMFLCLQSSATSAKEFKIYVKNYKAFVKAIIQVENPKRDPNAIGDKHLRNKAIGLYQIRKPYLDDANKIAGKKEIRRRWKKDRLTMQDMRDPAKAEWVFLVNLSHYGKVYKQITHKNPTVEVYARIHNGGPIGWMKKSTIKYGKAVVKFAKNYQKHRSSVG